MTLILHIYFQNKSNIKLLILTYRSLELHYPHFPLEVDFVHYFRTYGDLEQLSEGGELNTLIKLVQGWRRLQKGGTVLPDLIAFYQWLHNHLGECKII